MNYPIIYVAHLAATLWYMAHGYWATAYGREFELTQAAPKLVASVFYHTHAAVVHAMRHGKECTKLAVRWLCVKNQVGVGGH